MWAWLAYDLRFYRTRARMNGETFGRIIGVVRSTVSRLESGELRIDEKQAGALDKHFATGGHFLRLLTYAKLGHDPDWFKEHVSYESRAFLLKIYELSLIPGLLQTPEYARACFTAAGVEDVEGYVTARIARQETLTRSSRPLMTAVLSQSVIDWPVGGPEVMRAQLAHLLAVARDPNMIVRVLPRTAGATIGLDGSFKILSVDEGDVAYTEAHGGGRLILAPSEVRQFGVRWDGISAQALPEDASRSLIENAMEVLK
ncbi:Scr1 family TA system antitoxin-like transcriptional regulator [Actinomadura namibiensis]|uniref:Transcriptional regulator with XRE-family HTH domain n=1 Tax=Actinomadura namibiensis TaxID=182080 RepID=A0A7W3QPH0_ACTNM|nr:helix-turn-helix transcriptional regulator [Actinomadura namibiensis]MBA8954642.1 transcriptional regulator with XRE-family HTH domain [Actinomadura namibiensis]